MGGLSGKNVLVTGASSGFGRAIALAFAEAGANVALVARTESSLNDVAAVMDKNGVKTVVCVTDIGDEAQIDAAVEKARTTLGPIGILVNNAGTNVTERTIADTSADQWRHLLSVNLTSAFLFTKLLLPDMIARESGTVINISSRAGLYPSLGGGAAYSTSKQGMESLTQVTNEEANSHNVRACLICPGVGNTPILDLRPSPPPLEQRKNMLQSEDVAAVVIAVASMPQHVNLELISMLPTRV